MSKHYVVNCYNCQHNGQETCKGCRTLLVGEDEPYENWQLREDLETKDQKISDLEAKLAESEADKKALICDYESRITKEQELMSWLEHCNEELKQQLSEKDAEYNKLKQCFDKVSKNCTFEELREIILTGEENSNDRVIKMLNEQVEALEQQLADKKQNIEEIKQRLKDTIKIYSDDFVEKDKELKELRFQARNIFPLVENLEDKVNQDKISFTVERLEKVKEWVIKYSDLKGQNWEHTLRFLNNQIKELKEMK